MIENMADIKWIPHDKKIANLYILYIYYNSENLLKKNKNKYINTWKCNK